MAGCASDLNAAIRSFCNGNILTNEKLQIFHDILSVTSYRLPLESSLFRQTANEAKERLREIKDEWTLNEAKWRVIMDEQEKAIGMKSIRAYSGVLTYIDTVTGKTIPENEYEMKYKDYTAKVRSINITDVRNQLTTAQNNQFNKMTNNEKVCGDNDQDNTKENAQSNTPYMQCTEPRNDEHKHVDKKKKVES